MKTTIEIAADLLRRAKAITSRRSITLRALVDEGLRLAMPRHEKPRRPIRIRPVVARGRLRPEAERLSWAQVLEIANDRAAR